MGCRHPAPPSRRFVAGEGPEADARRNRKFKLIPSVPQVGLRAMACAVVLLLLCCEVSSISANARLGLLLPPPSPVAQGSWIIRQSVGTTPVILGQKLTTKYSRGQGAKGATYFEVRVRSSLKASPFNPPEPDMRVAAGAQVDTDIGSSRCVERVGARGELAVAACMICATRQDRPCVQRRGQRHEPCHRGHQVVDVGHGVSRRGRACMSASQASCSLTAPTPPVLCSVLIEGQTPETLPEQLVGTVRLARLDLKTAAFLDEESGRLIKPGEFA